MTLPIVLRMFQVPLTCGSRPMHSNGHRKPIESDLTASKCGARLRTFCSIRNLEAEPSVLGDSGTQLLGNARRSPGLAESPPGQIVTGRPRSPGSVVPCFTL